MFCFCSQPREARRVSLLELSVGPIGVFGFDFDFFTFTLKV